MERYFIAVSYIHNKEIEVYEIESNDEYDFYISSQIESPKTHGDFIKFDGIGILDIREKKVNPRKFQANINRNNIAAITYWTEDDGQGTLV